MAQIMTEAAPVTSDDIEIIPDPPRRRPAWLRWMWLLLPWTWFLVRGIHPWFEMAAILLPVLVSLAAFAALLVACWRRDALLFALVGSLGVFYLVAVVLPGRPIDSPAPESSIRFASVNVAQRWFSNNDIAFFVYDQQPDVFVGVELQDSHDEELRGDFEFAVSDIAGQPPVPSPPDDAPLLEGTYRRNDFPSIGIYSDFETERLPDPIADTIPGGLPGIRAQVQTPEGDIVVYALHVPRPGSGGGVFEVPLPEQDEMLTAIAGAIASEELPVVVIGDLNIVDRGHAFASFSAGLTDAMRVERWAGPTRGHDLWFSLLRLRIDHLLVDSRLCVAEARSRDVLYTDHTPIQADVGRCPAP